MYQPFFLLNFCRNDFRLTLRTSVEINSPVRLSFRHGVISSIHTFIIVFLKPHFRQIKLSLEILHNQSFSVKPLYYYFIISYRLFNHSIVNGIKNFVFVPVKLPYMALAIFLFTAKLPIYPRTSISFQSFSLQIHQRCQSGTATVLSYLPTFQPLCYRNTTLLKLFHPLTQSFILRFHPSQFLFHLLGKIPFPLLLCKVLRFSHFPLSVPVIKLPDLFPLFFCLHLLF